MSRPLGSVIPGCMCSRCRPPPPRRPDLVAGLVVVGCALAALGACILLGLTP